MAAGKLVADLHFSQLRHFHLHLLDDHGFQFVALRAREHLNADDAAALAVRERERCIADIPRFFPEYGAQEPFLRRQLGLALGRGLADEDIAGMDFSADTDNAFLIQILQLLFRNIGNIIGRLLGTELGVAHGNGVVLNMQRGKNIVFHQALRNNDGVLIVPAMPREEGHGQILAERQFP